MNRSASSSLRGYSYQFLESIYRLLDVSKQDDTIVLEGIEDVDVGDQCIQVKYLESKKLLRSTIRKPVSLMLEDFVSNRQEREDTKYKLYAHFGDDTGDAEFLNDDDFYKYCGHLIIDNVKNTITEINACEYREFKDRFKLEIGEKIADKEEQVLNKLQASLSSTRSEVETYFYPQAMHLIFCLSIKEDTMDRQISKRNFLTSINQKEILFGIWKRLETGKKNFLNEIKLQLSGENFRHSKQRLILIDTNTLTEDDTGYGLHHLLSDIVNKHSPLNKNDSAIPLTIVLDISEADILEVKRYLIEEKTDFNDGYEQIEFSIPAFSKNPIINTLAPLHKKISRTSYEIKLIRLETYLKHIKSLNKPQTILHFSKEIAFKIENTLQYHIQAVETYNDVNQTLN